VRRRSLLPLILPMFALPGTASSGELPLGKAAEPSSESVQACTNIGRGFFRPPGQDVCLKIGLDLLYEGKGDFTRDEIYIETERLKLTGTPAALYARNDVSDTVTRYRSRTSGTISLTAVSALGNQPMVTHVGLRSGIDDTNAADRRSDNDFSIPSTYLDQAWVSAYGITAGLRGSLFDYSSGYGYSGGYASNSRTNAISYEKDIGEIANLGVSIEDNAFRRYQEGVWAKYGAQRYPDLVLRGRLTPSWGNVHAAVAAHSVNDSINSKEKWGWAANAGVELRAKWSDVVGEAAGDMRGRLLLTGAYTKGALDYLGIPRFSADYIATPDGKIELTDGFSAMASYEHIWRPDLKTTATIAVYKTLNDIPDFRWEARGGLAQAGIEYMPAGNTYLGAEVTYFYDDVKGTYFGVEGNEISADFFQVYTYLRRRV
jgi:hypothetical protein